MSAPLQAWRATGPHQVCFRCWNSDLFSLLSGYYFCLLNLFASLCLCFYLYLLPFISHFSSLFASITLFLLLSLVLLPLSLSVCPQSELHINNSLFASGPAGYLNTLWSVCLCVEAKARAHWCHCLHKTSATYLSLTLYTCKCVCMMYICKCASVCMHRRCECSLAICYDECWEALDSPRMVWCKTSDVLTSCSALQRDMVYC